MSILIHLSDLHFGPCYVSHLGEILLEEIKTHNPDVVVVSGDLTLRARRSEFQDARDFLSLIQKPTLIIPGNHDQPYVPWERFVMPFGRFQKYIQPQTDSTLEANGFFVVGVNDNRPILPGGFWSRTQRERIQREFARAPRRTVKIIATHHQLMWEGKWKPAGFWHPTRALEFLSQCGVDIALNGHTHIPNAVQTSEGIVVSRASTVTCTRTRMNEGNSYNLISVDEKLISVFIRRYDPHEDKFISGQPFNFPRRVNAAT